MYVHVFNLGVRGGGGDNWTIFKVVKPLLILLYGSMLCCASEQISKDNGS